jgi:asparagine synthase (glutamine-hydrolysing)
MCGIAGLWASSHVEDSKTCVAQMAAALAHRGPDSGAFWDEEGVHLAHRRLAIVDLSPTGAQPMISVSGRFVISFNGEVYNYQALRNQLAEAQNAQPWKGSSDTEVMLAAIEAWGLQAAVSRFVGMFAFALWDRRERRMHLVRDRLGVKPLYWSQGRFGLAFASELKGLTGLPGFDDHIEPGALATFLRSNCVTGTQSIYRGTFRLPPASIATFDGASTAPRIETYWSALRVARDGLERPNEAAEGVILDQLDALLRDAVRLRMVADVPLGAFLSGGVDSSLVVALMQAQSSRPVHTFSIENETAAYDEGPMARAVSRHLGTQHTSFRVTARDALEVIPRLPTMFDEPFADSSQIPTYLVSKLARQHVTVALSGDGGDELFGGYTRHLWGARLWKVESKLPSRLRGRLASLITSRSPAEWDRLYERGRAFLPRVRIPGLRVHKAARAFGASSAGNMYGLLASHWGREDDVLAREAWPDADPVALLDDAHVSNDFMLRDLTGYLPDDVLTKVDRASMAVSLEAREPLLDHRLVEFAWRLPLKMKIRGSTGKWALRQVLARYVPTDVISGPKMGFAVPLGDWLRGPLRDWAESLLETKRIEEDGLLNARPIRERWDQLLQGTHPWEFLLWDVLMFQAWREAQRRKLR